MSEILSSHIYVSGRVQGVGYRDFAQRQAVSLHLNGYVRNLTDGRVELEVEGERGQIEQLIQALRRGPSRSKVTAVDATWAPTSRRFSDFSIRY
ncbi:MAG: acylphosphatase [Nitrospirae bacterium]|nr:acylphosphatase [Candidatus Manganitrophaceae bacterium]